MASELLSAWEIAKQEAQKTQLLMEEHNRLIRENGLNEAALSLITMVIYHIQGVCDRKTLIATRNFYDAIREYSHVTINGLNELENHLINEIVKDQSNEKPWLRDGLDEIPAAKACVNELSVMAKTMSYEEMLRRV